MRYMDDTVVMKRLTKRITFNKVWKTLFFLATMFALVTLAILLYRIVSQGIGYLNIDFLTNFASRFADKAGIKAALIGSLWLMAVVAPVSIILGVGTAIYLEEYAKKNRINDFIRMNISNLAGVPSIVFGLLGLTIFVRMMGLGKSILAAGFTMSLLILPVIIVAAQEAIRAVPNEQREASYGMGATKWQTILRVVLPAAIPGILTGSILAMSRAIGETAPLVVIGIPVILQFLPNSLLSQFTALPMQIYDWAKRPQEAFQYVAAAGILVLMTVLLLMNSIAIFIRNKFQKRY
ncbi:MULTISPECIES: phosphate ABC transporter permease PstA [Lysinibacillus]|jgi:phosphate transport system permease protein|uniref:Phosphate transport system permease protein PstA n=1 Tax=Lysinibacillus fusiformis TaxID=28031 RepID=A0A2I0V0U6_9BACI|nr:MULTISPECIES: phosphate ABC transporter permease PstA [Lysinibacillus]KUF34045.1 phosphate ABC transporter permease [Lysinibacillus sp. F5]MEE3805969.1 phosphate ABC transporter permease PstA [Lysinibacillus fusiformis]PKU51944.1 phosphate ABC transporter, permease protein PstA [Lysinibacillus fusiformis]WCH46271.1 phosphate ABC transporter permease PstA [Lysinibacillus sp. OF-1]SCZ09175.1 phosphate ABC transporter membrane protein 2, PhoT family [Lysinibacillus sp. SG9]